MDKMIPHYAERDKIAVLKRTLKKKKKKNSAGYN